MTNFPKDEIGIVVEHIKSLNKKLMFNQNQKLMKTLWKNDPFYLLSNSDWLFEEPIPFPKKNITFLSGQVVSKVENNKLEIAVNVTGHDPKNVNVELTEDKIYIKAETNKEDKSITSALVSDLNESLKLGKDFDGLTTKATIKDGILHLIVDKKEQAKPKKLEIKF